MTTLAEIEIAVAKLPFEQKLVLYRHLAEQIQAAAPEAAPRPHGVMDIAPVYLGPILQPLGGDDDLLDEMLQDRS